MPTPRFKKPKPPVRGVDSSGRLFDHLCQRFALTTDAQLAAWFTMPRSSISRIRHGGQAVTDSMILAAVEKGGMTVAEVRRLIAKPRFNVKTETAQ